MYKKDITYGGIIPLIGGMLWGAETILNKKPAIILSYDAFWPNDKLYVNYHITDEDDSFLGKYWKLYDNIDDNHLDFNKKQIDIMCALCPCAGLSQLNCSKTRGSEAPQNDWLYKSTEYVLSIVKPKVLFGENAPALYDGKHGIIVQNRLKAIGEKYGYSMTVIKTNSYLHGIPQNRKRSFYIFWNTTKCPILNLSKECDIINLNDFLNKSNLLNSENIASCVYKLQISPEYRFIKELFGNEWRALVKEGGYSLLEYIIHNSSLEKYLIYLKDDNADEKYVKKIEYIKGKLDMGLNFRDWSYHISTKYTNSLTGARMDVIHPTEDRLLHVKELMYLMGLPCDMKIPSTKDLPKLFQNVPSTTAAYWFNEIVEALLGNRSMSNTYFLKHDNIKKK